MRVAAVGDIMLQRPLAMLRESLPEQERLRRVLQDADFRIGNLEQCLSHRGEPRDKLITIRGSPDLARDIRDLGFDALGVANNHAWDFGPEAFLDTLEACRGVGLQPVGGGRNLEEACAPVVLSKGDDRVGVVAFSATLPPDSAAGPVKAGIAPVRVTAGYEIDPIFSQEQPGTAPRVRTSVLTTDARDLLAAVDGARAQGRFVVVLLHWGVPPFWHAPFEGDLAEYQRPLARQVARAGAALILGSHPHVVQGVELIGSCVVFYSLGNFIFHPRGQSDAENGALPAYRLAWQEAFAESARDERKRQSILVVADVEGDAACRVRIDPVVLNDHGEPRMASGLAGQKILERVRHMSKGLGTAVNISGESAVVTA